MRCQDGIHGIEPVEESDSAFGGLVISHVGRASRLNGYGAAGLLTFCGRLLFRFFRLSDGHTLAGCKTVRWIDDNGIIDR